MHAFLLDRDAERGKETKTERQYAVKRTNLPSRHANESSDATVFPSFFPRLACCYAHLLSPLFSTEIKPKTASEIPRVEVIRISIRPIRTSENTQRTDFERELTRETLSLFLLRRG